MNKDRELKFTVLVNACQEAYDLLNDGGKDSDAMRILKEAILFPLKPEKLNSHEECAECLKLKNCTIKHPYGEVSCKEFKTVKPEPELSKTENLGNGLSKCNHMGTRICIPCVPEALKESKDIDLPCVGCKKGIEKCRFCHPEEAKPAVELPEGFEYVKIEKNVIMLEFYRHNLRFGISCACQFYDFAGFGFVVDGDVELQISNSPIMYSDGMLDMHACYTEDRYNKVIHADYVVFSKEKAKGV